MALAMGGRRPRPRPPQGGDGAWLGAELLRATVVHRHQGRIFILATDSILQIRVHQVLSVVVHQVAEKFTAALLRGVVAYWAGKELRASKPITIGGSGTPGTTRPAGNRWCPTM